ncbi:MAG: ATP-dependent DNA helicase [Lachnospiraceae bacterium]|nr:ATP-dependent DNA helicase [Lachnospiraceae bacterium]
MIVFWDAERDKKEEERQWKKNLRLIGTQVDSFFMDKIQELKFEERPGQWEMAMDIVQGMIDRKHILVEASVGIGKTYAYVVPLLYYHKKYRKPIIIATSTISLQEQLANDIKTIEKILDYYPEIFIAKGQSHFLCKNRLENYFVGKKGTEEYKYYEEINHGGYEKSNWDIEIPDKIWNRINVLTFNPVLCRQTCPYKDRCFYYQLRMELRETNGFILCNQDLLAMNMKKRKRGNTEIFVSNYEYIVIDEVHNLENKIRSAYTIAVSYSDCKRVMWDLSKNSKKMGGLLDKKIEYCLTLLDLVFGNLLSQVKKQDKNAVKEDKEIEKYYVNKNIKELCDLVSALKGIIDVTSLDFGMEDTYRNRGEDETLEALEEQYDFFSSLRKDVRKDIFWMVANSKNKNEIIVYKCPKNVHEIAEQLLFSSKTFQTIMTSATVSSGGNNYDYFVANTNLPLDRTMVCDSKESPFDYNSHAILYYTENIPHPSNEREAFIEKGVDEMVNLLHITQGKALILFTAKRDMIQVYKKLLERVPYKILMQKEGLSQTDIIAEFKADTNSVLLGTGVYWEGISIEGKTLSNLIIFRLPFPVPEPIIDYKRSKSKDGLMNVLVPEMIIKLKQGMGRLIRNKNDSGIVSIIDPRLGDNSKVPYKQLTWDALAIKNRTNDIKKVKEFYLNLVNDSHL